MPYCTPSNTTSQNVWELCPNLRDVTTYYVSRPYITRHGSGPLCTNTKPIDITDVNNPYNEFQGTMRACEFDVNLLEHSLRIDNQFNKSLKRILVFSHGKELSPEVKEQARRVIMKVTQFEYEDW